MLSLQIIMDFERVGGLCHVVGKIYEFRREGQRGVNKMLLSERMKCINLNGMVPF